jgi:hypothetical protein
MKGKKLFLYSLTSLAVIASSAVSAEELATAPSLEGGVSLMLGGFLFVPSTNNQAYATNNNLSDIIAGDTTFLNTSTNNNNMDYDTGWQAAIGYIFDNTANGIELSYRNFNSSQNAGPTGGFDNDIKLDLLGLATVALDAESADGTYADQNNKYQNWDLMVSQFIDIGTHVQMRFLGGLSYLDNLGQTSKTNTNYDFLYASISIPRLPIGETIELLDTDVNTESTSRFSGLGPRVGMDARYDFGDDLEGFGIVGGASLAYFLGDLKNENHLNVNIESVQICDPECGAFIPGPTVGANATDQNDNHAVTNLRANLAIDYVYYFEDQDLPTLGLELGYEVDTFFDGVGTVSILGGETDVTDVTFSGPYLNIKGVF